MQKSKQGKCLPPDAFKIAEERQKTKGKENQKTLSNYLLNSREKQKETRNV